LFEAIAQSRADWHGRTEVERCASDRIERASRDQRCVDRGVALGGDGQQVMVDAAAAFATEMEIAVVGQIQDRRLVRGRTVVEP
jgi:hypothetical protein